MLKINTHNEDATIIFDLEGKLAGPWVDELEHCWRQAVTDDQRVRVVLTIVTFIDAAGIKLLTDMHRQGAELVAQGCMTKAIVEEIKQKEKADESISRRSKYHG
jgi:anti-anti-sigma regulatory factor